MRWGRHRRSAELAEFYKRVMRARAMAEVADLGRIKAATDWKAPAWHRLALANDSCMTTEPCQPNGGSTGSEVQPGDHRQKQNRQGG